MLIFKIKGITSISSEKCFNYIIIFFFENAKNLCQLGDTKWRKKREMMALPVEANRASILFLLCLFWTYF